MAVAMAVVGSLFRFVDWGVFRAGHGMAPFLWAFGALALVTAGTGSRVGRPVYLAWMQAHPKTVSAKMRGYVETALPLLPAPRPWPSTASVVMRQGRAVDRESADEAADEEAVAEAAAGA
jgi:hypothetical protein